MFVKTIRSTGLFLLLVGMAILNPAAAFASSTDTLKVNRTAFNFSLFSGFLWAHHTKMEAMYEHRLGGVEIDYAIRSDGTNNWESYYGYPEYGMALSFYDLGSPNYLGNAYAIQPYIAFPFLGPHRWGNIYFKAAIGVGYVTKPWDRFSNYKNVGIGSHLNAAAKFELRTSIRLSNHLLFNMGLAFSHMSNGSTNNPNSGINMPNLNIGATYAIANKVQYIKYQKLKYDRKLQFSTFFSYSSKDVFPDGIGHYPVYTLSNELCKPLNQHSGITASWDIMLDESHWKLMQIKGDNVTKFEMIKTGLTVGYLMKFNKVGTTIQIGSNLYSYYKTGGSVYQRLGLRYEVLPKVNLQVALRTNWFNADCIEFGVGYKFTGL